MTNYNKGANFERRVKHLLEKQGYLVVRSAGSKGVVDLMAIDPFSERVHLIQCKTDGYLSLKDKTKILELSKIYKCIPVLAYKNKDNGRVIMNVIFEK